jgi:hypothetical protein
MPVTTRRIRINYTGMDTVEPECEFDKPSASPYGITDIWADETIYEDPDYVPEDDCDDDDDDDYDYSELDDFTPSTRRLRNLPRVDYTGMDTVEPESEFDGITDIWADTTIDEDPDFVPEF